jgi:hypothetical protein
MPQQEFVTDILQPTDPEIRVLISLHAVARYWGVDETFARQRLREHGVRFARVDSPLMVRWRDIQEFEKAHTIILEPKAKRKEVTPP